VRSNDSGPSLVDQHRAHDVALLARSFQVSTNVQTSDDWGSLWRAHHDHIVTHIGDERNVALDQSAQPADELIARHSCSRRLTGYQYRRRDGSVLLQQPGVRHRRVTKPQLVAVLSSC